MFVKINDFYLNTNYISDVTKSTVEVEEVTKYLLTYILADGSTIEELFDTESEANTKLDEIEKSGWIGNLTNIYVYKGSCLYAQLPQSGNSVGDVWNVEDEFTLGGVTYPAGTNVAWAGSSWDVLAGTIDTSTFELKSNKTTTITNNSTDIQYPSAKAVYTLSTGLQSKITSSNKLDSDLVDDTNQTNKFVTAQEKSDWNAKSDFSGSYNDLTDKPSIPDSTSDLTNDSGYITKEVNDLTNYTKTTDLAAVATTGEFASLLHKPTTVSGYGITDAVQQVTTMPTASSSLVDRVVQYVGTTGTYINSYFYKCVNNSGTYAWEAVSVQAGGGGTDWDYVLRTVQNIGHKSSTWTSLSPIDDLIPQLNQILTDGIFEGGTIKPLKIVIVTTDSTCGAYDGMFILQSIYLDSEYSPTYYFAFKDYNVNVTLRCIVENNTNTWSYRGIDATDMCIAKYTTMPYAEYALVDTIVQYVGTTDANYTNGYFYKCVEYATEYSWERIDVQPTPVFENIQVQDITNVTSSSATPNFNFSTIKPGIYHINYTTTYDWDPTYNYFYYIIAGTTKGYFSQGRVKDIYVSKSFTEATTNEVFALATVVKYLDNTTESGLEINYQIKKAGSSSITFVEDTLNSSVEKGTSLVSFDKLKQSESEVDLGEFNPTSLNYDLFYNKSSDMYNLIANEVLGFAYYPSNNLLGRKILFKFTDVPDDVPDTGTAISDADHYYVAFHPIYSFSSGCGIQYQYILSSPILNLGKATGVIYIIFSYYNHTNVYGYPAGVTISFRFLENKVAQNDGTSKFALANTPVTKSYVDDRIVPAWDYVLSLSIYNSTTWSQFVDSYYTDQLDAIITDGLYDNSRLKKLKIALLGDSGSGLDYFYTLQSITTDIQQTDNNTYYYFWFSSKEGSHLVIRCTRANNANTWHYKINSSISKDVNDLTYYTLSSNLATVATTGDYEDLSNTPSLTGYEVTTNKVTSISVTSTNTQYPSAKCIYDELVNVIDLVSFPPTSLNCDVKISYNSYPNICNQLHSFIVYKNTYVDKIRFGLTSIFDTMHYYCETKVLRKYDGEDFFCGYTPLITLPKCSGVIYLTYYWESNDSGWMISYRFIQGDGSNNNEYATIDSVPPTKKYVDDIVTSYELLTNKVTSMSSSSTDTQYPSAKAVYDYIDDATVLKIATLPTASADNLGKVYQFVGTTTSSYTNGFFYQCVSDGQATPTYSWAEYQVQSPAPMYIMSYGHSTWDDFITAYNKRLLVYCRASSSSNPASGSQTRMAFMAYVNSADSPTEVEFQYYRSVSSHTASQQGDQVFVYKLNKTNGWSVTTREASVKVVAGTGLTSTYSNNTITLKCENNEVTTNKVTSISSSSTDTQYPSAKAVYTYVENKPQSKFDYIIPMGIDLSELSSGDEITDTDVTDVLNDIKDFMSNGLQPIIVGLYYYDSDGNSCFTITNDIQYYYNLEHIYFNTKDYLISLSYNNNKWYLIKY